MGSYPQRSKTVLSSVLAGAVILVSIFYQMRSPQDSSPADRSSGQASAQGQSSSENLGENELLWAGLSGAPPRFIDSGDEKGLGYLEVQTKLIRRALLEAGFKIRYEYFSSARVAHEFSRKTPICFYPTDWNDPEKVFAQQPDKLYSISIDFNGEENRSIVVRKEEEGRFLKFVDSKGLLSIKRLLADSTFKTLIPKTDGLGPEFQEVFRTAADGSIEIAEGYKKHISTRVMRDNRQLIQMLNGGRFDYLLDTFIIQDDYKSIRAGKTSFKALPYAANLIQNLTDKNLLFTSVTCSIHDTTLRAMPVINSTIKALRGPDWSIRNHLFQDQFDPGSWKSLFTTVAYRFSSEIAGGKADFWYPKQLKYFPGMEQYVAPPQPLSRHELSLPAERPRSQERQPAPEVPYLLLQKQDSAWLIPRADAAYLASVRRPGFEILRTWTGPRSLADGMVAWSQGQLQELQNEFERPSSALSLEQALQRLAQHRHLKSISIHARLLTPDQLSKVFPLLPSLTGFELVMANPKVVREILPNLSPTLEKLNLWGSSLADVRLAPLLRTLPRLKTLDIGNTAMDPKDFEESLLALPDGLVSLGAAHQVLGWSEELAMQFGKRSFRQLEALDLEYSGLDDRHCGLFSALTSGLQTLRLNGNQLTSICLQSLFKKPLPKMKTLELAMLRISTRQGDLLTLPPSVSELDLTFSIYPNSLSHLKLPSKLKSLRLENSIINMKEFEGVASHLDRDLEELVLSDNSSAKSSSLGFPLFQVLQAAGVKRIKDLRVANLNLSNADAAAEEVLKSFEVEGVDLTNTRLSSRVLSQVASAWGPRLRRVSLNQNLLTSKSLIGFLEKSPGLRFLALSDLPDLELQILAPKLPRGLLTLTLDNNGITDQDVSVLVPFLPERMTFLDLSGSFFGERGAESLAGFLARPGCRLVSLVLATALPEEAWALILGRLPGDLANLRIGPATLGPKSAEGFLNRIPKGLASLHLESVQLSVRSLSAFTRSMPPGLLQFVLYGNSRFLETSESLSSQGAPEPAAHWPDSLRMVMAYSGLDPALLRKIARAEFPPSAVISVKGTRVTGEMVAPFADQARNPRWFDINGGVLDSDLVRIINQFQLNALTLNNLKFGGGHLAKIEGKALKKIKTLSVAGSNVSSQDLLSLLKKLPPHMFGIGISSTALKFSDVDDLIRSIPPGLFELQIKGTEIGPKGIERLKAYSRQMEEKTGVGLRLFY